MVPLRALLRYGSQFLLVFSPLITSQWSLLNWLGHSAARPSDPVALGAWGLILVSGAKEQVELKLRLAASAMALAMVMTHDLFTAYLPSRSLREFRKDYLDEQARLWKEKLGSDIRINVMYARHKWYFFFLARGFDWCWSTGFEPPDAHHDANLFLTEFQGVCGKALRTGTIRGAYAFDGATPELSFRERYLLCNQFHLWPWQLRKTRRLQGVVSVPIFRKRGGSSPTYKAVGIINLDTLTADGARRLRENERELGDYFARIGKILAKLAGD